MKTELLDRKEIMLGDIVKILTGFAFKSELFNDQKIGIPLIRIRDLEKGDSNTYYSGEYEKEYVVEKEDLLISMDGEFKIFQWKSKSAVLNQRVCKLIINEKLATPKYILYIISKKLKEIEDKTPFVTVKHISSKQILAIKLFLPPLSVQQKIVSILEEAEKLKHMRDEADKLTKDYLKTVFFNMFSKGITKESDHVFLEDMTTKITDGEHITPRRVNKGIYLLSARNILNHRISLENTDFIDEEEFNKISKRIQPQLGDVLVSCSGSVGRVARVKDDYRFQLVRSVALIRPNTGLNPVYLEYFFDTNYMQMQITKSINQSSQANLFQGKIKKLRIYLPPLEMQNKFATIVKEIGKIEEYQKQSKVHIENLFNNLIQKVFKGELAC